MEGRDYPGVGCVHGLGEVRGALRTIWMAQTDAVQLGEFEAFLQPTVELLRGFEECGRHCLWRERLSQTRHSRILDKDDYLNQPVAAFLTTLLMNPNTTDALLSRLTPFLQQAFQSFPLLFLLATRLAKLGEQQAMMDELDALEGLLADSATCANSMVTESAELLLKGELCSLETPQQEKILQLISRP